MNIRADRGLQLSRTTVTSAKLETFKKAIPTGLAQKKLDPTSKGKSATFDRKCALISCPPTFTTIRSEMHNSSEGIVVHASRLACFAQQNGDVPICRVGTAHQRQLSGVGNAHPTSLGKARLASGVDSRVEWLGGCHRIRRRGCLQHNSWP